MSGIVQCDQLNQCVFYVHFHHFQRPESGTTSSISQENAMTERPNKHKHKFCLVPLIILGSLRFILEPLDQWFPAKESGSCNRLQNKSKGL